MAAMPEDIADESLPDQSLPSRWSASVDDGMWVDLADDARFTGAELNDERSTLVAYLNRYRLTMEWKCADLDARQLARRSVPPSTMSLLGLVRHMADVERMWFRRVLAGQDAPALYWSEDDPDMDWIGAVDDPEVVARAWQDWRDEVAFAEQFVSEADDLSMSSTMGMGNGTTTTLRSVLVHMIEEYARHCGHADLLRERIDGRVGQ
jgi:uncharacterized damage-inducible protein DinB